MKKNFRSFEEAREFVQSLGIKGQRKYKELRKSGKIPDSLPSNPFTTYKGKGWKGWGDFLGTGYVATYNIEFLPFEEAREFVNKLGLKDIKEWREYRKSGKRPINIPSNPDVLYRNKGWKSMGDWLGTGYVATYNREYLPFEEAREFVRSLKIKSQREWNEYSKSGKRPDYIPNTPEQTYKAKGWKGMGDWLGTGNIAVYNRKFLPYEEAKVFVRSLGLTSWEEWRSYCKSGQRPNYIPSSPNQTYKGEGWKGIGDWLGTGRTSTSNRTFNFLPFEEAKEFARSLNLKGWKEWKEYTKSGNKPDNIPSRPNSKYKSEGWVSVGDWLGTGSIASFNREFLPFEEAKEFARSLNLKSSEEWEVYRKSGERPDYIPSSPDITYGKKGWSGWGDFLGTGNISTMYREFLSFEEAREFARNLMMHDEKEWREYSKSSQRPDYIPSSPESIYKDKGWKGYLDWLRRDVSEFILTNKEVQDIKEMNDNDDMYPADKSLSASIESSK